MELDELINKLKSICITDDLTIGNTYSTSLILEKETLLRKYNEIMFSDVLYNKFKTGGEFFEYLDKFIIRIKKLIQIISGKVYHSNFLKKEGFVYHRIKFTYFDENGKKNQNKTKTFGSIDDDVEDLRLLLIKKLKVNIIKGNFNKITLIDFATRFQCYKDYIKEYY